QAAPCFHPTMKILNGPPRTVAVDGLPGLLGALHWQSTEQDPFQGFHLFALRLPTPVGAMFLAGHKLALGFLLAGRLRLPHAHHPKLGGITSRAGACLGGSRCMQPQLSCTWAVLARRSCSLGTS